MKGLIWLKRLMTSSLLLSLISCNRSEDIEPKINYTVQSRYLSNLSSPFPALSAQERSQDWGREYLIGVSFAKRLDLYRAITALRRAEILAPDGVYTRKLEMNYEILLCYYLGKRYDETEATFRESGLISVNTDFPAFHDLLVILYDTYQKKNSYSKACHILEMIKQHYPETYQNLSLSSAMQRADFPALYAFTSCPPERPYLNSLLNCYDANKKSQTAASMLNAIIPGTGYLYLGQTQTAITAFLVNGLFIWATVHFFQKGPIAAGIVTLSFEAGWYLGGIYGASEQAKYYNERLYESLATPMMNQNRLFPIFQLNYAF